MLIIFAAGYVVGALATLLVIGLLRAANQSTTHADAPRTRAR